MDAMDALLIVICVAIFAPFIVFFCGKWGAVGWFRGKHLAENKFPDHKKRNATDDWN
jgi:hypothetical protein